MSERDGMVKMGLSNDRTFRIKKGWIEIRSLIWIRDESSDVRVDVGVGPVVGIEQLM